MTFIFISTSHLEKSIWFKDDEDFTVGMNYIAIAAYLANVRVIAFILMSNHIHVLVECPMDSAIEFINKYKKLYSFYYRRKYGVKELLRKNSADFQEVGLEPESLERVIAYILMNCVAARICLHPSGYKWGSCNSFFNSNKPKGTQIGKLRSQERRKKLRSWKYVPKNWIICDDGYILPDSYICLDFVEALYGTPSRMTYFLNSSSKAKRAKDSSGPSFKDQNINAVMIDICQSLFQKYSPDLLDIREQRELLHQLHRRFGADLSQLSRVTGIPYPEAARMLDEF